MRAAPCVLALLAAFAPPAEAADPLQGTTEADRIGSGWELRLGGSMQDPVGPEGASGNVTVEALAPRAGDAHGFEMLIPRAHLGGSLNLRGDTSFGYAGLTWVVDITPQLFAEGSFGGAFHDGNTGRSGVPRQEAALGCSPLFRESASLGYRLSATWSVIATVEHLSNAGLCSRNRGLTNMGLRVGHVF